MTVTTLLLRPLVGAVIGYITNDIAIRMLFRPRTAKYIFGMKVPFTPGLIPKEKSRIAASIGNAISKNLMNKDVLERTLLSEDMLEKISSGIDGFVDEQKHNGENVESFLGHYLRKEEVESMRHSIAANLSGQIHTALSKSRLGSKVAHIVVEHVMGKVKKGVLGMFSADQFLSLVAEPAENLLSKNIDEMLENHSQSMVETLIGDQIDKFMDLRMEELFKGRDREIEQIKVAIIGFYKTIVREQLPKILEAVDISKIVESRINEMDVKESEKLILDVMNKELKAIVWLGALLGFLMGCVNLLF